MLTTTLNQLPRPPKRGHWRLCRQPPVLTTTLNQLPRPPKRGHWRLSRQPPVLTTTLPTGPAAQERGHWRLCRQPPVPTPSEPAPRKPEDLAREVFRLFGTSLPPVGRSRISGRRPPFVSARAGTGTSNGMLQTGRWARLARRWLAGLVLLILLAGAAIAVALQVTPMQTVTVAGQVIQVGASAPGLGLSGPGEVDLFGQSLPTDLRFAGPGAAPAAAVPDHHQQRADQLHPGRPAGRRGAHPRRPAGRRVEALLRLGDGDHRGGRADPGRGGRGLAPHVPPHHRHAAGRRAGGGRGHQPGRHHDHRLHGSGAAAPGALPERARRHRDAPAPDPPDRPAAARRPGRGHRGLHRGRAPGSRPRPAPPAPSAPAAAAPTPTRRTCRPPTAGRSSTWPATAPPSATGCSGRSGTTGTGCRRSSRSRNGPGTPR